jgi:hypothetical protein
MTDSKLINNQETYQGLYPTVFKKVDTADIMVNPFQAHKSWLVASGSSTSSLLPLTAIYTDVLPALGSELTYNDAANIDGSLQTVIYYSINHLYYKYKDEPTKTYGPTNLIRTQKHLYQSASVFSIPQLKYGEAIKPESFEIQYSAASMPLTSDRYGNIYNPNISTASFASGVIWYEGFNEYFDTSRVSYVSSEVTYVPGVPDTDVSSLPIGLAAKFSGTGYIESDLNGFYDRDHDYAIAFWLSGSNSGTNKLIATKASSSLTPQYPFRVELSGSNQIVFSIAGSTTFKTQITSSVFNTGSWNHFVCQKSGSLIQIYKNGLLELSSTSTLLINTMSPFTASARIDNTDKLYIGGYSPSSSNLTGVIDEVRIFNKSLSTSDISSLSSATIGDGSLLQTNHYGNVFTKQGIAVVSTPDYRYHSTINDFNDISYKSTVTIYELGVVAKLDAGDFNMSTNLTLTQDDDMTYYSFVSGSDFAPYITTIGLYNDAAQLLAVGKLAQPVKKRNDVDMNFLVRIDLDKNITKG